MTVLAGSLRAVTVESIAIDDPGSLVALLEPLHPLAFMRGGDGIVGIGEALRLEFTGPSRFTDAAAAWAAIAESATVLDPIAVAGSGLVAFGSFAFADGSPATSVLVIPAVLVGRRDGRCWVTRAAPSAELVAPHYDTLVPGIAPPGTFFSANLTPGTMSPPVFTDAVREVIELIRTGVASKVVIARDLVGDLPAKADLRLPIGRLAAAYPDNFKFAVDGLIGSSPETLVRVSAGTVTARVLAGTSARGADDAADSAAEAEILTSTKDLAEHEFALASVLAALEPHSSDLTANDAPFALALPNLWHLASDVTGTLTDGSGSLDLVAALHPTAAVAGFPTAAALSAIAELELFDRGRYAGPVGWVDARGDGEWAVALRCAQVTGDTVTAYAGAGIVADSDPERELAETALKFLPIAGAFG